MFISPVAEPLANQEQRVRHGPLHITAAGLGGGGGFHKHLGQHLRLGAAILGARDRHGLDEGLQLGLVGGISVVLAQASSQNLAKLRLDDAGFDKDNLDIVGRRLDAETVGPALKRMLGGMIPGPEGGKDFSTHGGDVHDPSGSLVAHGGQNQLGEVGKAEKIDLELVSGILQGDVLNRPVQPETRVVDQDVNASPGLQDPAYGLLVVLGRR